MHLLTNRALHYFLQELLITLNDWTFQMLKTYGPFKTVNQLFVNQSINLKKTHEQNPLMTSHYWFNYDLLGQKRLEKIPVKIELFVPALNRLEPIMLSMRCILYSLVAQVRM